jgi:hypothetical protein
MAKPNKTVRKPAKADGPLYRVTEKSYIDGKMVGPEEKTDIVQYDGVPGSKLLPLNAAAEKAKAEAEEANALRRALTPVDKTDLDKLNAERDRIAKEAAALAAERTKLEAERAAWENDQKARSDRQETAEKQAQQAEANARPVQAPRVIEKK